MLLVVPTSQIYISLFTSEFKISVAIILVPVLLFLMPEFPVLLTTVLSAPGVFLLRAASQWLTEGTLAGCWQAHAPEMLFYLTYGVLFHFYTKRVNLHPFQMVKALPLVAIDALANFFELLARMELGVFSFHILLRLVVVGVGRMLLTWSVIRVLDYYGFQVLRREDRERYQRLLVMTAALKSEMVWMEKGTTLIESTMNTAYHLYSQLRSAGMDSAVTDTALTIAKDIHEVKKEYYLIMRGISEAMDSDAVQDGMELKDLVTILQRSVERSAKELGKEAVFTSICADQLYLRQYHYLMSVFRNLLNNALEAAGTDRPAHISFAQWSTGTHVCFEVSDDCGGIPPGRIEQIFTPGFSSKINYTTGEINRGLGLTIVKGLVEEELGGTIRVRSHDGGTIFTVRIPKQELEESQDAVLSD